MEPAVQRVIVFDDMGAILAHRAKPQ